MFAYSCPRCSRDDQIIVSVLASARLLPGTDDNPFETDIDSSDHEFDGTSPCHCSACQFVGVFADFSGSAPSLTLPALLDKLSGLDVQCSDLDDYVHDSCVEGASHINNQGVPAQVRLLVGLGNDTQTVLRHALEPILVDCVSVTVAESQCPTAGHRPSFRGQVVNLKRIHENLALVQDEHGTVIPVRLTDIIAIERGN